MIAEYFYKITFSQPLFFWLFLFFPLLIAWYIKRNNKTKAFIRVSSVGGKGLGSWKNIFMHLPFIFRLICFAAIITAFAKPQTQSQEQFAEGEGIDIILCIDVSGSMTAQDFTPNRLEAAKNVAIDFINKRLTDRVGIVIFSGESFTQCPLTTDRAMLVTAVRNIHNGLLEDGTAIGDGLSTSVDRLRASKSKTKVVLLLTDGENNGGNIDPKTAKEIAKAFNVRIYTIGVGSEGYAVIPESTKSGVVIQNEKIAIDEKLLTEIATETGGKYYRARDNESLSYVYKNIDALEKSKIKLISTVRYQEKFFPFVCLAIFFLLLEMVLNYTVFRKFP